MELKAILELERNPFQEDILIDDGRESFKFTDLVRLYLYLLYYRNFFELVGIPWQISIGRLFLNKSSRTLSNKDTVYFSEYKSDINNSLFKGIISWSSWNYGKMEIDDTHVIINKNSVESYLADRMPDCNELGTCDDAEWRKMILKIPELCIDSKLDFDFAVVYICWNKKLASYLNFRRCNLRVVDTTFSEGDSEITRILQAIRDPLQVGAGLDYTMLMEDRYLLGFFESSNYDECVDFFNLHMHFGINMIILELLLDAAVQMFGL